MEKTLKQKYFCDLEIEINKSRKVISLNQGMQSICIEKSLIPEFIKLLTEVAKSSD